VAGAVVAPARRLIVGLAVLFVLAGADTASAGSPILVVESPSNHFSSYVPEIMRAEGLNGFDRADVTAVSPATIAPYDVIVLGDIALTPDQVNAFAGWVGAGGNLIALSPDPQLAGLLGIAPTGGTASNAYLAVDTSRPPGAGIVGGTIQYHGTADLYALAGAVPVATLYSDAVNATPHPAVTLRAVGATGGEAAAFTFDLARSTVYTRQGNPAWVGQDRDPFEPIRTNDLFFGGAEPNWVDLSKIHIPQADELQRLFANLITYMNRERTPVPRFWYLPRDERAAVVMTGDDHADGGTAGRFDQYKALGPAGCSVANWECVRSTSYIYTPNPDLSVAQAQAYQADGFEIALHPTRGGCTNPTPDQFRTVYGTQLAAFGTDYPGLAKPRTSRFHCVSWPDWATHARVEVENGIRLDTNYYHYPPAWGGFPGFMTGSGEIMRFADLDGSTIDLYQAHTHLDDEVLSREDPVPNQTAVDTLLGQALGPQGFYGMFTANMHTDDAESLGSDVIVQSARANGVPVISARQALEWVEARDGSSFGDFTWANGRLGFTINAPAGANGLRGMVPMHSALGGLQGLSRDGVDITVEAQTIKGVDYGFFTAPPGRSSYVARYPFALPLRSTSGPGGRVVGPGTNDRLAPRVQLKVPRKIKLRRLLRKGLSYRLTCSEACSVRVQLKMKLKKKRKPVTVASKRRKLGGAAGARIAVKPGRKAARKLRRAKPKRLTLRIRVADAFGNARVITRRVRLIS
jgi:hypothetical protein